MKHSLALPQQIHSYSGVNNLCNKNLSRKVNKSKEKDTSKIKINLFSSVWQTCSYLYVKKENQNRKIGPFYFDLNLVFAFLFSFGLGSSDIQINIFSIQIK